MPTPPDLSPLAERAVGAARFAAVSLATVSFGFGVLVLSGQPQDSDNAIAELDRLASLDIASIMADAALRNEPAKREVELMRSMYRAAGLELAIGGEMHDSEVLRAFADSPITLNNAALAERPLVEIDEIFSSVSELTCSYVLVSEIADSVRQALSARRGAINSKTARALFVNSSTLWIRWTTPGGKARTSDAVLPTEFRRSEEFVVPFDLLAELSSRPESASLVEKVGSRFLFLPATKQSDVWRQVQNNTVAQATEFLARRRNDRREALEVFGLLIPEGLVSWLAPSIVFALAIHLLIHVEFLAGMIQKDAHLARYPWIPLMTGWRAMGYTHSLLWGLPTASLAITFWFTFGSTNAWLRAILSVVAFLAVACLARAAIILRAIAVRG